ncbi:GtrA family protein [Candidatus Thiosymbion oneisti]|uniref:GtrA family protein n=1 Tax=Candidatus Thiosymbion oneisti TaxID=589554 RepID=UPI000B7FFF26|nr:GtrA family protein [Candidatus Thiosymbion oneisti]
MRQSPGGPGRNGVRGRLRRELFLVGRFGLVGILATAVHMAVVWLLVETTELPVLAANLFAFLTAFTISFAGNYLWTFAAPGSARTAMRRFFLISGSAFAVNTLLLAALTKAAWLAPAAAAVSAAAVIPFITYLTSRLWGFKVGPRLMITRGSLRENLME